MLNLELPPADVDVNVHPTKKEVRYKNTNQVFNFIFASIQAGLTNYIERQSARSFDPQSYTPQPVQQSNVVDFVQPKLESSGEIYFDKKDDTLQEHVIFFINIIPCLASIIQLDQSDQTDSPLPSWNSFHASLRAPHFYYRPKMNMPESY